MFLVDPISGADGTYPGSPAGWFISVVPVQELKQNKQCNLLVAVEFGSVVNHDLCHEFDSQQLPFFTYF